MNIVCKLLPIRHRNYFDYIRNELDNYHVIEIHDKNDIRNHIIKQLFEVTSNDYLLVYYDNQLFVVEKDSDRSYCKKVINHHPLLEKVRI